VQEEDSRTSVFAFWGESKRKRKRIHFIRVKENCKGGGKPKGEQQRGNIDVKENSGLTQSKGNLRELKKMGG